LILLARNDTMLHGNDLCCLIAVRCLHVNVVVTSFRVYVKFAFQVFDEMFE